MLSIPAQSTGGSMNKQLAIGFVRDGFTGEIYREMREAGQSLNEIVTSIPELPDAFHLYGEVKINGDTVQRHYWSREYFRLHLWPKADGPVPVIITLHLAPAGGESGGGSTKSLISLVATIALVAAGSFITGGGLALTLGGTSLFAAGSFSAAALAGVVGIVGRLAIAQLSAPAGQQRTSESRPLGQAGADGNVLSPFASGMRVCGTMKVFPPMASLPLVELYGDDEYVECCYMLEGPHTLSDFRVEGTPFAQIEDIQAAVNFGPETTRNKLLNRYGYQRVTNYPLRAHKRELAQGGLLYDQTNPQNSLPDWHLEVTQNNPDEVWLQYVWPAGMTRSKDYINVVMPLRLRLRIKGTSTWINLPQLMFHSKIAERISKKVVLKWGNPTSALDTGSKYYGAYQAHHTVPIATNSPGDGGWTAHSSFVGGANLNAVAKVNLAYDGFTIYLDPAVFPAGKAWEIHMKRGCLADPFNWAVPGYVFNPVNYGAVSNALATPDLFGFMYASGYYTATQTYIYDSTVVEACLLMRIATVWNKSPLNLDDDASIEIKLKNKNVSQLSCVASGLVAVPTASGWAGQVASSNPTDHFRHVLMGKQTLARDRLADVEIDDPVLLAWRQNCITKDYQIGAVFDGQNWTDVLNAVAAAGRAKLKRGAKWGVVIDRDTALEQPRMMFTPRNSNNITLYKTFDDVPDGIRVTYRDRDNDWASTTRLVLRPGVSLSNAVNVLAMDAVGIDRTSQVDEFFSKSLKAMDLRDYVITLDCWFESLAAEEGDVVRLNHVLISKFNLAARIVEVVTNAGGDVVSITIDQNIASDLFQAGTNYGMAVTIDSGTVKIFQWQMAAGGDTNRIVFAAPLVGSSIQVGFMVALGELGKESLRAIINQPVKPTKGFEAHITCVPEAPEIWA
jgi:hypothetical protein